MSGINAVGFLLLFLCLATSFLVDCSYGEKRVISDEKIDQMEKRMRVSSHSTTTEAFGASIFDSPTTHRCSCGQELSWNNLVNDFHKSRSFSIPCPTCNHQHALPDLLTEISTMARESVHRVDRMGLSRSISKYAPLTILIILNADIKEIQISSDQSIARFQVEWGGQTLEIEQDNQKCILENRISLMEYCLLSCGVHGNIKWLKKLISFRVNPNIMSKWQNTVLHNAINFKKVDIVKYLIEIGVRLDINSGVHGLPTHFALKVNNLFALDLLLKAGADLESVDMGGKTILTKASEADNLAALALLSQYYPQLTLSLTSIVERIIKTDNSKAMMIILGLKIEFFDKEHKIIALAAKRSTKVFATLSSCYKHSKSFAIVSFCNALVAGRMDNVEVLKSHGFNLNDHGRRGISVLSYAISEKDKKLVEKLLEMGATMDETQGEAFLVEAIKKNSLKVVQLLLKSIERFKENNVPRAIRILKLACKIGNLNAIEELLSRNDIFAVDFHLISAFQSGNIEIFKHFLNRGFVHKLIDGTISWFMHNILIVIDLPDVIQTILQRGANFYKDTMSANIHKIILEAHPVLGSRLTHVDTPAVTALLFSRTRSMKVFLDHGFNPNYRIFSGTTTLLHLACELKNIEIARLLIKYGADTNALDNYSHSPFSYIDNSDIHAQLQDMSEFL